MHDVFILCGGMKALFNCTTTSDNGYLQWSIDEVPLDAFTSENTVGQNYTRNGSLFIFTSANNVSGVFTSTASLNILQTTDVKCSDGLRDSTYRVSLIGKLIFITHF